MDESEAGSVSDFARQWAENQSEPRPSGSGGVGSPPVITDGVRQPLPHGRGSDWSVATPGFSLFAHSVVNIPCLWGTIPSTHMNSPTASETMNPGRRLGHYEVEARVGSGGMGTVYQALDTRLNRVVALKVLSPDQLEGTSGRGRLMREAQAARAGGRLRRR